MDTSLVEALRAVTEFKNVPVEQLEWLASKGKVYTLPEGDMFFAPGTVVEEMRVVLKGKIHVYMEQAGNLRFLDTIEENEITGILPYSRMKAAMAKGIVEGEASIFGLHRSFFPEMIRNHYELTEALVHSMTDRVRYNLKQQQLNDKMMSLGKLSAGLAHELNNPSAAVIRSASELKKHLGHLPDKFKAVIRIKATDESVDLVNELLFRKIAAQKALSLSLMERTEKEDILISWFEDNDVTEGYKMAEAFAEFGFETSDFENLKAVLREEDRSAVFNWLYQVLTTERLVNEIEEASRRINGLVTSIKSYTHMDQAPEKERSDVHTGIRNTVTMLAHKIRKNNVQIVEKFSSDVPQPMLYVSAINQVWTNLIDNAVDALEGVSNPTLEIHTQKDRDFVRISVIDNGPGIPPNIQDKIFDSFFTTKAVGKGTGLGLEMVRQIVSQHNGKVEVSSVPGRTEFKVCLPAG